jgi:hypothetical protein
MLRHRWCGTLSRLGMGLALVLGSAACTAPPPPASSVAAADPAVRVPAIRYRSVTLAAGKLGPTEPQPWQDLNRNVAPPPAPKGREP